MNISSSIDRSLSRPNRVAVLVDGENVSVKFAEPIMKRARKAGDVRIKRVFGNACMLPGWDDCPGFRLVHTGSGKNSADMKLAIDAMNLVCDGLVDQFVIVTSDSDFSHLAYALCERGLEVIGMGEYKTPAHFRLACSAFCCLNPPVEPPLVNECKNEKSLDQKLVDLLRSQSGNGGLKISQINPVMRQRHNVKISEFDEKTWRGYLQRRPELFACDPKGPNARVRLKSGV